MKSKDLQLNRPVSRDLQSFRPDMRHQKTLQFLQILQIGLGVVGKVKRDRRATLAMTESGRTAGKGDRRATLVKKHKGRRARDTQYPAARAQGARCDGEGLRRAGL